MTLSACAQDIIDTKKTQQEMGGRKKKQGYSTTEKQPKTFLDRPCTTALHSKKNHHNSSLPSIRHLPLFSNRYSHLLSYVQDKQWLEIKTLSMETASGSPASAPRA